RPAGWPEGISQKPEQQLLLLVQLSPSVVQPVPSVVQVPLVAPLGMTQWLSQHSMLARQLPVALTHVLVVEQVPPTHDNEQQSAACVQAAPKDLHSPTSMQR